MARPLQVSAMLLRQVKVNRCWSKTGMISEYFGVADDSIASGAIALSMLYVAATTGSCIARCVKRARIRKANAPAPSVIRICFAIAKSLGNRRIAPPSSVTLARLSRAHSTADRNGRVARQEVLEITESNAVRA